MPLERLDVHRTAFLFLDFQVDVCGEGGRMMSQDPDVLARFQRARDNAAALLHTARGRDESFVAHVVHRFAPGYPELAGARPTGMARHMMSKGAFVAGTPGADVVPELQPGPDEPCLAKTSISPFETTDLAARLQRRRIDTVVLCGVVTHYVVLATAFAAGDRGYRVVVASDGCASGTPSRHDTALAILGPLTDIAPVASIEAALD